MNFVSALRTDSKNGKHYILSCKSKKKKVSSYNEI